MTSGLGLEVPAQTTMPISPLLGPIDPKLNDKIYDKIDTSDRDEIKLTPIQYKKQIAAT
jgi:hypothetical protein